MTFVLITLLEIAVGGFIVWGFWHEEKIVDFEDKLLAHFGITRNKNRTAKITPFTPKESNHHSKNCI